MLTLILSLLLAFSDPAVATGAANSFGVAIDDVGHVIVKSARPPLPMRRVANWPPVHVPRDMLLPGETLHRAWGGVAKLPPPPVPRIVPLLVPCPHTSARQPPARC